MEKATKKYFCIFALPTMLAFTIGFIVPFLYGIFLSFCKFTTVSNWKWVGFKNYSRIFVVNGSVDTSFIHSIWYTALFTLVSVLIINLVSFGIAMALTKGIRGTNIFRHPQDEVHYSQQPLQSYRHGVQQGGIGGHRPGMRQAPDLCHRRRDLLRFAL